MRRQQIITAICVVGVFCMGSFFIPYASADGIYHVTGSFKDSDGNPLEGDMYLENTATEEIISTVSNSLGAYAFNLTIW